MSTKIVVYSVPVYAAAKFEIDKPEGWDEWSDPEKSEHFLTHMDNSDGLCHSCSDSMESDYSVVISWPEPKEKIVFEEE